MTTPTPTDLFSSLTLDPSMALSSQEVRERAVEIQDVLSSFDRQSLPFETAPNIFDRIDRPQNLRLQTSSDWTVQGDLYATLLQWGAYDENAYEFLRKLQSPNTLARCFFEKLGRRFNDCINNYDQLTETNEMAAALVKQLRSIADSLHELVAAVREDRVHRELGEIETLRQLLKLLADVCARHTDLSELLQPSTATTSGRGRQSQQASHPGTNASLFDVLIRDDDYEDEDDMFMLETLEHFSGASLRACSHELDTIVRKLRANGAPSAYVTRIEALRFKTDDAAQAASSRSRAGADPASSASSGSTKRSAAADRTMSAGMPGSADTAGAAERARAEPKTGTKRPQPTTEGSGRRGRKKTGR